MPGANVNEDDLPSGMEAATRYLKHGEHLDVTGDSTEGRP
jgi:hypothetical protein